jgi:hypothetical protein
MPTFPTPPVHGRDDDIDVAGSVRNLVGNRNYSRQGRFGGDRPPRGYAEMPRRGLGLRTRLRRVPPREED